MVRVGVIELKVGGTNYSMIKFLSMYLQVMVQEDSDGVGLVAHFVAHANGQPISTLAFDPSGILLFTADSLGHSFHVFKVMSHPLSCALGAVHHLYTLHRGDTTAKVNQLYIFFTPCGIWGKSELSVQPIMPNKLVLYYFMLDI